MPRETTSKFLEQEAHPEVYNLSVAYVNELMALAHQDEGEVDDTHLSENTNPVKEQQPLVRDQQLLQDFVGVGSLEGYRLNVVAVHELPVGLKSSITVLKEVQLLKGEKASDTKMYIIEESQRVTRANRPSEELAPDELQSKKVNFYILTQQRQVEIEDGTTESRLFMYVEGKVRDQSLLSDLSMPHTEALAYVQKIIMENGGEFTPESPAPAEDRSIATISLVTVTDIGRGTPPAELMTKLGGKGKFVETFAFAYPILQYRQGVKEVGYKKSSELGKVGNSFINLILRQYSWLYKASNREEKVGESKVTIPAIDVAFEIVNRLTSKKNFRSKLQGINK
jgi:hypothetical protein